METSCSLMTAFWNFSSTIHSSGADDSAGDYSTVYATTTAASKTLDVIRSNRSPFTIAPKMNRLDVTLRSQ